LCASTHHWLIRVLLELDQADSGDVLHVHVSVGAVRGLSVQIRGRGRGGHPQRIVAVDLVGHHVVGLQQSLEGARTVRDMVGAWPPQCGCMVVVGGRKHSDESQSQKKVNAS